MPEMTLELAVLAAVQSMVGDVPNPVQSVQSVKVVGQIATAAVTLFDGAPATLKITNGPVETFEWTSLPGGPFYWDGGAWLRGDAK